MNNIISAIIVLTASFMGIEGRAAGKAQQGQKLLETHSGQKWQAFEKIVQYKSHLLLQYSEDQKLKLFPHDNAASIFKHSKIKIKGHPHEILVVIWISGPKFRLRLVDPLLRNTGKNPILFEQPSDGPITYELSPKKDFLIVYYAEILKGTDVNAKPWIKQKHEFWKPEPMK